MLEKVPRSPETITSPEPVEFASELEVKEMLVASRIGSLMVRVVVSVTMAVPEPGSRGKVKRVRANNVRIFRPHL